MKKLILGIMAVVIMILLNNCGGGDNRENVDKKIYEKYIELKSDKNTTFILKGKENDALTLMIPSLPVGKKDQNISITLRYINNLPSIEIDKDIVFNVPVILTFKSSYIEDENITLIYKANDKNYYVPSLVNNHTLKAKLMHFSKYGFDNLPSKSDRLKEDISSRLSALDNSAQTKRYAELNRDDLNDLYIKIKAYKGAKEYDEMIKSYADSIALASDHTIKYYKNNELKYFSGSCPTNELLKALTELFTVEVTAKELYTNNEVVRNSAFTGGILQAIYLSEAKDMAKKVLDKSKEAWDKIEVPKCNDKSKLWEYIECSKRYISDLEMTLMFYDDLGVDGIDIAKNVAQEMEDSIVSDAMEALSSKECDCMLVYLDTLNVYFIKTQKNLIEMLRNETKKCGTRCPLLWDITVVDNGVYDWNPDFAWSGSATWKDVYIDETGDSWVKLGEKERIACEPYKENYLGENPKAVSVTGDIEPGVELYWLYVRVDDDGTPYIQLLDWNIDENIYNQLNNGFQQFTVSGSEHGTTTYTFTPTVPGYVYPNE